MSRIHDLSHEMPYIRDMIRETPVTHLTRELGDTLRTERRRRGLTQAELARRAGIGRQKLIQVEQGKPGRARCCFGGGNRTGPGARRYTRGATIPPI